jgi:predicted nucleotidyltransferase
MRLTHFEIEAITGTFKEVFESGKIYLFGSRVDDTLKGGDIDLYIDTVYNNTLIEKKIDFLVSLKRKIGEQKIDVVLSRDKNRPIEQEALNKGIALNTKILKMQKQLNECNRHKIRIEKSYAKVKEIFPLSAPRYQNLNDDEIEAIDQYLFRFAKLQDTLGKRVFRMIVSEYEENAETLTFFDVLNRLEKIGLLDDVNVWKRLRDVRNNISHQYDDEPQEMAEALNNIFAYKSELIAIFDKIEIFANKGNTHEQ